MKLGNKVMVGDKPMNAYINALVRQFVQEQRKEVVILSRGFNNAKAIDLAQIFTRKYVSVGAFISSIKVDGEEFKHASGNKVHYVSTLAITLTKKED